MHRTSSKCTCLTLIFKIPRASLEDMSVAASQTTPNSQPPQQPATSSLRSNLVENAAPMSFTGVPGFDSNV